MVGLGLICGIGIALTVIGTLNKTAKLYQKFDKDPDAITWTLGLILFFISSATAISLSRRISPPKTKLEIGTTYHLYSPQKKDAEEESYVLLYEDDAEHPTLFQLDEKIPIDPFQRIVVNGQTVNYPIKETETECTQQVKTPKEKLQKQNQALTDYLQFLQKYNNLPRQSIEIPLVQPFAEIDTEDFNLYFFGVKENRQETTIAIGGLGDEAETVTINLKSIPNQPSEFYGHQDLTPNGIPATLAILKADNKNCQCCFLWNDEK